MSDLVQQCLAHTKREYPDGYGFALTYLADDLNPISLRDAANRIVGEAFTKGLPSDRRNPDLLRYVAAYGEDWAGDKGWRCWLVEAAQLVHTWALAGDKEAGLAMALCGHPGYEPPYKVLPDRLSGTCIIERACDGATSLRFTGREAQVLMQRKCPPSLEFCAGLEFTQ